MIIARLVLFIIIFAVGLIIAPILGWMEMFKQVKSLWAATGKKRISSKPGPAPTVNFQNPPQANPPAPPPQEMEKMAVMTREDWAKAYVVHWDKEGHG
jgi:hypothetical protein